ncbi:hypothetical protein [Corallococcus interemptor]|nr:hypothetical protein [Corallococcus interemptor]
MLLGSTPALAEDSGPALRSGTSSREALLEDIEPCADSWSIAD